MSRCPDQVISLKRDPQCLSSQASLVLIHRPTAGTIVSTHITDCGIFLRHVAYRRLNCAKNTQSLRINGSHRDVMSTGKSGDQHSPVDAVSFLSYPRHARLERRLVIWLVKKVFDKLNGSKTVLTMSSMYSCAVSVPLKTPKGVRLSKKMAPQTISPGFGPVWCAIVKTGPARCPRRLQARLR
ncbi:hypothetical protein TNCV_4581291 [Trichonephila clavipes]|nr:hypothetical protein TNCV_4581291 [Trichonephila clavipes]